MKRVKHLMKKVLKAYVNSYYQLNKPLIDSGLTTLF